ncbi:MAG: undecaprenyl-diphosphate phosphatase [Armatimonadetes bacterium]|nr:undecaprenyl-diphosphate phosphatase [Armatimonadota bacterium]
MGLIQAVVYGLIQGLTEFLPISSSGHLYLVTEFLGWKDAGSGFTAVIQLGTILAVLIYFRSDLGKALAGWAGSLSDPQRRGTPEAKTGWAIAAGTVPIVVLGLVLEKWIDREFRSAIVVGSALIVLALVLWWAEKAGKNARASDDVTVKDGIVIGLWQCLALIPGSSRSGCTITGGLFSGFDRSSAARFSFLLSVPAILLSGVYKLIKERHALLDQGAVPTIVATLVSFVVGYAAIAFLMRYLQTRSTGVFVVYRLLLGVIVLVLAFSGRTTARPTEPTGARLGVHQTSVRT